MSDELYVAYDGDAMLMQYVKLKLVRYGHNTRHYTTKCSRYDEINVYCTLLMNELELTTDLELAPAYWQAAYPTTA